MVMEVEETSWKWKKWFAESNSGSLVKEKTPSPMNQRRGRFNIVPKRCIWASWLIQDKNLWNGFLAGLHMLERFMESVKQALDLAPSYARAMNYISHIRTPYVR
ncbi:unnamed protein product [Lathyrus oleraceus]